MTDDTIERLIVPAVVSFPAEVDLANSDGYGAQLQAAFRRGEPVVIADLTATTFCDSTGVRQFVLASRHAAVAGAELRFVIPSPGVMRVLQITGLDKVLRAYTDMNSALSAKPGTQQPGQPLTHIKPRRSRY
jgi:anti-anti-sigma factor